MSKTDLFGKVALITGAGFGIGRGSALAFAAAGAKIVVADRDSSRAAETTELILKAGGEAIALTADVSIGGEVDALVERAVGHFGRLDCAFNNAGVGSPEAVTVAECSDEHWDRVMSVNLRGVFLCMRAEIRQMLKQGGGAIVNSASVGGLVATPRAPAYIASKHGVIGLTRTSALDHARQGIRVNALCPGFIDGTAMMDNFRSKSRDRVDFLSNSQPMGRLGTIEEIAEAAIWLCSDAASFVTGTTLAADGGFTAA